jgi:hypothetical protein
MRSFISGKFKKSKLLNCRFLTGQKPVRTHTLFEGGEKARMLNPPKVSKPDTSSEQRNHLIIIKSSPAEDVRHAYKISEEKVPSGR